MAINSKEKGKRGERELANLLNKYGYITRRGQQFNGADGSADVIGLEGIHIECKRVEKLNVEDALNQAIRDCKVDELPTVFHRKNREQWKVTMLLDDWLKLYDAWRENEND